MQEIFNLKKNLTLKFYQKIILIVIYIEVLKDQKF